MGSNPHVGLSVRRFYEFGPFRLEPEEHLLLREGRPAALTPKAFDLLVLLVQNQSRLIAKDEIMRAVWPDSFVEDANITVLISALRKVLGEREAGLPYIETVPKKGYRFAALVRVVMNAAEGAPVEGASESSLATAGSNGDKCRGDNTVPDSLTAVEWRSAIQSRKIAWIALAALACLLALIGYAYKRSAKHTSPVPRSLAILPLRNLKQDPDSEFLGFSLSDAVITKLGAIRSVTVRPSSAIEKYKGQAIDIRKVAGELHVDTVLAGNFIRDGDRLRITYQLIDVNTLKILSKDSIDVKYDELLVVQDNVVHEIIKGLELNLSPTQAERVKPDTPVNPLAYEYYLRGVDLMGSHNFPLGIKMLEKSTEIDPTYARAWAYLGQCYTSAAAFEFGGREQYRKAQAAYERALVLKPGLLETQVFLANLLVDTGKVEQAVPLLRNAIKGNPTDAAVHWELGYAYRFAGMLEQSVSECEQARQIDPAVKANFAVLNTYLYLGRYDEFLGSLPDVHESAFVLFYRGFGEYHQRKLEPAVVDFDRAYQLDPNLYTQIGKAFSDSITRKTPDGLEILRQLERTIQQRGVGDPEATYKMAQAYAVLGDRISAIRMLNYSVENGFFAYPYFIRDPLLENVRDSAQFRSLVGIARERHDAFKKTFF
ncbi:MAG TPA: winged helix-turn-helix domain-containing protein [Bryobacteraceae bacterium]|nr:winged helix-turn-helix domain-containing protein [Bryobacteraceae bacterium]